MISAIIALLLLGILFFSASYFDQKNSSENLLGEEKKLVLWYTDDKMKDYFEQEAKNYYEQTGVEVEPVLVSGLEYLETINRATKEGDTPPDLYILGNDCLEKAYLAGLAKQVDSEDREKMKSTFVNTALSAVSYKEHYVGYPLFFETTVFVYNKTYLYEYAKAMKEKEADLIEGEAAMEDIASMDEGDMPEDSLSSNQDNAQPKDEVSVEQREEMIQQVIPRNMDEILEFASNYDAPDTVEGVLKWDVSDIFFNYFFVGNALNVGGEHGDNTKELDLYNEEAIRSLMLYQSLNQFFYIDTHEISYDSVLKDFVDGKTVFTFATTDVIDKLKIAIQTGDFAYDYGVSTMPDVSKDIKSKSLSLTSCVVINGYSNHSEMANEFAKELTMRETDELYQYTGKLSPKKKFTCEDISAKQAFLEYEDSVPMIKLLETSNFWVQLEIAFSRVWNGADANQTLRELSEEMKRHIQGVEVEEQTIQIVDEEESIQ